MVDRLSHQTSANRMRAHLLGCLAGCGWLLLSGCSSTPLAPTPAPAPLPPTSATAGTQTIIAIAPPAAPASTFPTLPEFLGLSQLCKGGTALMCTLRDRIAARLGTMYPGLEPKPPLLTIADPANLSPDAPPSVQTAAKIKQEQDAGAQKAKAAAYLATVGCGCYEGVAEALAANLSDCNEEVRFATAKALREIGTRSHCPCGGNSCCTLEVHKELMRLAWETDHTGCFVEPSPRVRRMARLALKYCCAPIAPEGDGVPEEGPELEEGEVLSRSLNLTAPQNLERIQTVAHLTSANGWEESLPAVLALVNGEPVEAEPVLAEVQRRLSAHGIAPAGASQTVREQMLTVVLSEAIDRKLLAQTARNVLSTAVQSQLDQQVAQASGHSETRIVADPVVQAIELEAALAQELLRRQVDHDPSVSAAEITEFYEQDPQRFRRPDQVRWRHYWIEHADVADLNQVAAWLQYVRAQASGEREVLPPPGYDDRLVQMQQYDWMSLAEVPLATMRRRLQPLGAGQASEIYATPSSTSFLLVSEVRTGETRPLSEVRSAIIAEILTHRRAEAEAAYIAQLRSKAEIQLLPDVEVK